MKKTHLLLAAATFLSLPSAWAIERYQNGFVYVVPPSGKAALREKPDPASKIVATPANGVRVLFRRVDVADDNSIAWYFVEPPGQTPGWLAATDAAEKRPNPPPPGPRIKRVDSGVASSDMKTSAAATAAARGFDARAKRYAEKRDLKRTADELISLETAVAAQFNDKPKADGTFPPVDPPERKQRANAWKKGVK